MQKTILKIKRIEIKDFNAKESKAKFDMYFDKNNKECVINKEFYLSNSLDITNKIVLAIKSEGKMIVEEESDDILSSIYITRIENEEEIEGKLFSFFNKVCERTKDLKSNRNATQYMKLYNEIKIMKLVL